MSPERRQYERTPDTVAVLTGLVVASALMTATGQVPPTVRAVTSEWVGLLWSGTFASAAAVSLVGIMLRDPVLGWVVEMLGRGALVLTAAPYLLVLTSAASNLGAAIIVAVVGAVGVASAARVVQIWTRLRRYRRAYKHVAHRLGLLARPQGDPR